MRVLVLCHGNINRSPLVEAILRRHGIKAKSAGFRNPKRRAAKKMREAAKQLFNIDLEQHRSQLITPGLWLWATVILYMDGPNKQKLMVFKAQNPGLPPRTELNLAVWSPAENKSRIPDPNYTPRGPEFNKLVDLIGSTANRFVHKVQIGEVPGVHMSNDPDKVTQAKAALEAACEDPTITLAQLRDLKVYLQELIDAANQDKG